MTDICYACGTKEVVTNGFSNIEKIPVDSEEIKNEEKYMPLCDICSKKWEKGELEDIEEKWVKEKQKEKYSSFESGMFCCDKCGKELKSGIPYHSVCVHKEKEVKKDEIEVLDAEVLFAYCGDCFKNVEVTISYNSLECAHSMKFFKNDGKQQISAESAKEVSLEKFLEEIDRLPTNDEFDGGFIGITNSEDETINLVRFEENSWLLDFPILKDGEYFDSLQNDDLTTKEVTNIITRFFHDEDWRSLVSLKSSKKEPLVDKTKRRIEIFKEVGDEGTTMISEEVLSKKEFIKKLEEIPKSTNDTTHGIFAELSRPFNMIKNSDGTWKVMLDAFNPNVDIKISKNEKYSNFEKILDIKKWVNEEF